MVEIARRRSAFSLIEIILVITLMAMLASIATLSHRNTVLKAKETILRHNLHEIRVTLDQYNVDKGHYPETLQVLVDEGYLRELPLDPITQSSETWEEILELNYRDEDSNQNPGVFDVRSGSAEKAIDGTSYAEW